MKIEESYEQEGGFEKHAEGDYIFQVQQSGVDFRKGKEGDPTNKSETFMIRCESVKCLDGAPDAVGGVIVDFITLISAKGDWNTLSEKRLATLLTVGKLREKFQEKYPDDAKFNSDDVVAGLKLKLPGVNFGGRVVHEEFNNIVRAKIQSIWDPRSERGKSEPKPQPQKQTKIEETPQTPQADGDDW